jgi:hypothetical protein
MNEFTIKDIVDGLNEALDLLGCAGPNRLLIDSDEYFERLEKLQDKFLEPVDEEE